MLQKLFVSYQLRADPLRKEWLLAAPALQRPAIAGLSRCAKDQMTAAPCPEAVLGMAEPG